MPIVDTNGLKINIDVDDTLVFIKDSRTICFNRGSKLYFSSMVLERDKIGASFIKSIHDFFDFSLFIGDLLGLDGKGKDDASVFFWRFLRKQKNTRLVLPHNAFVAFDQPTKILSFFDQEQQEISSYFLPFIKSEYELDDLLIILGYLFEFTHAASSEKTPENIFKRVFV